MSLLLIAPMLLCGYFYCHAHSFLKIKIEKKYGQYLYLTYFVWGLTFFLIALSLVVATHNLHDGKTSVFGKNYDYTFFKATESAVKPFSTSSISATELAILFYSTILSLVIAGIFAYAHNRLANVKYKNYSQYHFRRKVISDNPEMLMLSQAALEGRPLLFTLRSGKIYVGQLTDIPISTGNSLETSSNLTIYPIISGYRSENNKIAFTTSYQTSQDQETQDQETQDQYPVYPYMMSLNRHEISTISFFDIDSYHDLQNSDATH